MKRILFADAAISVAASLCLLTSAAQAADVPIAKAPGVPAMVRQSWTGSYAGVHGGYAWNKLSADSLLVLALTPVSVDPAFATEQNGTLFGGQIGANYELPNHLVVGIVADISRGRIKGHSQGGDSLGLTIVETTIGNTLWTVRGKLGYGFDNLLLYGTAGFASASAAVSFTGAVTGNSLTSRTVKHKGWVAGVGAEFRLAGNWLLGAEYRYLALGTETYHLDANVTGNADATMPVKWRGHQAIATLNYQF